MEHWCVAMGANKIAAIKPSGVFAMTAAHMDRSSESYPEVELLMGKAPRVTAESDADRPPPPKKSERAAFFIHFKVSHLHQRGNKIPGQQVQRKSGPAAALR